jgi:hypothetical protein
MPEILYLGDTALNNAAAYLAGVMHASGWRFSYRPSDREADAELVSSPWKACVLSDYPATRLAPELQQQIVDRVRQGAGLLMIGGWESFHGLGGQWNGSPIGEILPVEMQSTDDRVNCDSPVFVRTCGTDHPILRSLPWTSRPPLIGGYNRFRTRPGATQLLEAVRYSASFNGPQPQLTLVGADPLLVINRVGSGRVAALATDVAPHWVGHWVDWGTSRVQAQGPGAEAIEVGDLYAQFFRQLVEWVKVSDSH